jgi:hypothetical protein
MDSKDGYHKIRLKVSGVRCQVSGVSVNAGHGSNQCN